MSCYHPKTVYWYFDQNGEVFPRFSGREYYKEYDYSYFELLDPLEEDLSKKIRKVTKKIPYHDILYKNKSIAYAMPVPCGKCLGCRLDYSRTWADRMCLEYDHTKKAVFVTLTYNDSHLKDSNGVLLGDVDGACLCKRDIQLFLKRLRKKFSIRYQTVSGFYIKPDDLSEFEADPDHEPLILVQKGKRKGQPKEFFISDFGIRFYCSGEYGPRTMRPHYHMILFGVDLSDFADESKGKNIYLQGFNDLRQPFYRSDVLDDLWSDENGQIGFAGISEVSYETFAYVARYTLKKVYKDELSPEEKGLIGEWALMSRRPGLSAFYLSEHPDRFISVDGHLKKMSLPFQTKNPIKSFPKYLVDRLEIDDPNLYYNIREQRQRIAQDQWFQEIDNTDKSEYLYLLDKERNAVSRTKSLLRHKDL